MKTLIKALGFYENLIKNSIVFLNTSVKVLKFLQKMHENPRNFGGTQGILGKVF